MQPSLVAGDTKNIVCPWVKVGNSKTREEVRGVKEQIKGIVFRKKETFNQRRME